MTTHHIVAMLPPAWGHTISYIYVAVQMISKDPALVVTILQHNIIGSQMEAELATCSYDKTRLRIIGVGDKDIPRVGPNGLEESFHQLADGWMDTIPRLCQGTDGWPKPQTIHLDFGCGGLIIEETKKILGPKCKVLVWFSSALASMPACLNEYDFTAIAREIFSDENKRNGRSMDDILLQVIVAWNGSDKLSGAIVKFPGAPGMYDHERGAYAAGPPEGFKLILPTAQTLAKAADGYIVPTSACFEPVGVPYCRELYKKSGQELFAVGMQTRALCGQDSAPVVLTNEMLKLFLGNAVETYGANSVLYISFGSLFFPTATPQLIEALVNTLLNLVKPFPFVLALGGKLAALPKELIERVNSTGKGLVCDFWVEQRAILQHPAVGWFLTHGGFNSISESLAEGVPLIVWPIGGEQPINAAFLSSDPNPVAFELLQIRTGPQLGPSLRGGPRITGTVIDATEEFKATFDAARGARGATLRSNVIRLAEALKESAAGEASEEIIRLAKF
ncbi:hypothetical protein B0H14DRAFT_2538394 [Mycena olivaceomarginata]|nr:hypothetical protein B0H14DRAFT_2538394 [Mycena olivaceomarginata]